MKQRLSITLAVIITMSVTARPTEAQLVPNDRWYTIESEHFRIHFTRPLEDEARRGAVNAERAFAQLATELKPPRGKIDLVVADNVDFVNGYATTFPSNRIVIYAHPPVDASSIRNYNDWSALVITHELTHIFHLDRTGGIWKLGRSIFGRHPALFPNAFQPAWLIEGLAVYYESRVTGAGRLEGPEHYMIARAAAEANRIPRIGELSRATSRFPGGETVYAYGGFVFDHLARTRGPESVARFIELASSSIFPLTLNQRAKKAFGISFDDAWKQWSDSLVRTARPRPPMQAWRELSRDGRYVGAPRWVDDSTIVYAASTGRDVTSLYEAQLDGSIRRLSRRNGLGASVPIAGGGLLFSQADYTNPFNILNDLYVEKNGRQARLTRGARLWAPDVRRDGSIVAVQNISGSTRLVRVTSDGKTISPLTAGDATTQWSDPRWSPVGTRIAAIRIRDTGISELVVLDTTGRVVAIPVSQNAIVASPSWGRDGARLFYTSSISGTTQVYETRIGTGGRSSSSALSSATTGLLDPEPSPTASMLAALHFQFDGYHLGVAPLVAGSNEREVRRPLREGCTNCLLPAQVQFSVSPASLPPPKRYSPWRSLAPRYWEPLFEATTDDGTLVGAATSGNDVIGRHSYYAQALFNPKLRETHAFAAYQYAGLGQPFLDFSAEQSWEHFPILDRDLKELGDLARRARIYQLGASFTRPRFRTFASMSIGGEIETRDYQADPDSLIGLLSPAFATQRVFPSIFTSLSWSNARRPALSISREDGVALTATARQRWESGEASSASRSIVAVANGYRSLDLPGFAHHVIALRAAAGIADKRAISSFSAGGLSGTTLEVVSGVNVGNERRTFGVRGFPPSAEQGIRAFAGSLEYRAPIAAPSTRVPYIPVLFDRISMSAFADAGRAYCPGSAGTETGVCGGPTTSGPWLASGGAELNFDTAIQYDIPARFRLGVAAPVTGREAGRARRISAYFTVGASF
ncbi:MAG TPA: hypothetical protein VM939_15090 [Gemmatimonadaceae bacterium]|nr:hypothetical protein [Gemmatimonadaceae bacterium]